MEFSDITTFPITNDCKDYGLTMEFSDTTTFTSVVGISADNTGTTFTGYAQASVITNYCDDDFAVGQSFTDLSSRDPFYDFYDFDLNLLDENQCTTQENYKAEPLDNSPE